jgi:F0F1-type ATP synthase delta subunit
MQARAYALALIQFLTEHPRTEAAGAIERLKKVLVRRGHSNLLPRIVAEFEKEVVRKERAQGVVVTVAGEKSRASALAQSAKVASERGIEQKNIHVAVDPALIGGFRLRGPGFRYDASTRTRLKELYKQLTTAN